MPPIAIECVRNIRREALASFWEACYVAKQNVTKPDHIGKLIGLSIDLEELHSASWALEARVDEVRAGNQELQSYVQCLDSELVDEAQERLDELNYLTDDDLPSEIPSSDVVLRELKESLRQKQQDPGPNSGSDAPSDSA